MGYDLYEDVSAVRCREERGLTTCYLEDEDRDTIKRATADRVEMTGVGFMNMIVEDDGFPDGWSVFSAKDGATMACNVGDNRQGEDVVGCEFQR